MRALRPAPRWLLGALVLCTLGCRGRPAGQPAPTLRLRSLDGGTFRLQEHRGRPVLLVFWATWCGSCKRELAELSRLRRSLGADALTLAAPCGDPEQRDRMRRVQARSGPGVSLLLDPEASAAARYGVSTLPTTVLLDARGMIRHRLVGWGDGDLRRVELWLSALQAGGGGGAGTELVSPSRNVSK